MDTKHISNYETLYREIFGHQPPENINLYSEITAYDFEIHIPSDALEVAEFSAEVENWNTWKQQSFFYVCRVPKRNNTYLLFSFDWDDNWTKWTRQPRGAVEGPNSLESASEVLLRKFAEDNIGDSGNSDWRDFLRGLKNN